MSFTGEKTMSSDAQIAANRLNAEKSTGPTSPEGKANSRFNSLRSGLYAKSAVLPGEDAAEREALAESFRQRFQPKTPEQAGLVDELIHGNWILRRLRRSEESLWQEAIESAEGADPGQAYKNYPVLDRVMSRITGVKRACDSDLRLLVMMLEKHGKTEAAAEKAIRERAHRRLVRELLGQEAEDGTSRYRNRAHAEREAREIEADELDDREEAEDAAEEERLAAAEAAKHQERNGAGAEAKDKQPGPFQTSNCQPISRDSNPAQFGTGQGEAGHVAQTLVCEPKNGS
jgi:hypothetical protein